MLQSVEPENKTNVPPPSTSKSMANPISATEQPGEKLEMAPDTLLHGKVNRLLS